MRHTEIFKEARRLYKLGAAIHWLHPRSKRPIESGWGSGPRKEWSYLAETYIKGLNLGVRLGTPSKIGENYLAVVDVDVKSKDEKHRKEAVRAARALIGGAPCPVVKSGRGNGSRHYYCVTAEPFKTFNPAASEETVKVHMPSKKPSKKEIATLSAAEISEGIRLSPAWEISLYSDGRQVVLPPSIHPDSGKEYIWTKHLTAAGELPLLEFARPLVEDSKPKSKNATNQASAVLDDFAVEDVDLAWLPISDRIRDAIISGKDVHDRSAFLLPAASALHSAGLTQNEILSVLTDPETFLGATGYDHAKTKSRARAAAWVYRYSLAKILDERSAIAVFKDAPPIESSEKLSQDETEKQNDEFEDERDWRQGLERTEKGKYRNTLNNCKLIMTNVCGVKEILGRNEFAANDYYLADTPWRSKSGAPVTDADFHRIRFFCAERFGIEFSDGIIDHTIKDIADVNRFHPVRDWLNGLKWDGIPRIDTWLKDFAGAKGPEPYLSDVSRKVLCALVKRVFRPGCKFDYMLILEGKQGKGKSTLLERLVGEEWFTDAPLDPGNKDTVLTMQSKWLIELGELSTLTKSDLEIFKAFVSQRTDRMRTPYGKKAEDFARQCVFIGTTNQEEYLRDLTGNRRFWSVATDPRKIDFDAIAAVREQLFAEAMTYYQLDEELYLTGESEIQATAEQAKRLQSDEWLSTVQAIVEGETFPVKGFEMKDVAKRMDQFGAQRLTPTDVHRITRCFKLLGFERFQEPKGQRRKLWRMKTDEPRGTTPNRESRFGSSTNEIGGF